MLKHKLRKTSEIINFRGRGDKKKQKEVIYSKVRKSQGRKISGDFNRRTEDVIPEEDPQNEDTKGKHLSSPHLDGGYFTGPESFYETPDSSRLQPDGKTEGQAPTGAATGRPPPTSRIPPSLMTGQTNLNSGQFDSLYQSLTSGPQSLPLAVLVPVPIQWVRRSTPAEDFLYTSQCVGELVKQQSIIVKDLSERMENILHVQTHKEDEEAYRMEESYSVSPTQKMKTQLSDRQHQRSNQDDINMSTSSDGVTSLDTSASSGMSPTDQIVPERNASAAPAKLTSMKRLQRIMEIEDMIEFSEKLDNYITRIVSSSAQTG